MKTDAEWPEWVTDDSIEVDFAVCGTARQLYKALVKERRELKHAVACMDRGCKRCNETQKRLGGNQ